jgi:hypothetical protein
LPNNPGTLTRAAGRLGEPNININYAYAGIEPNTNVPLLFFGVAEVAAQHNCLSKPLLRRRADDCPRLGIEAEAAV